MSADTRFALSGLLLASCLLGGILWLISPPRDGLRYNDRFGIAFISAADNLATDARYTGGLAAGARWNRWPLYWHWVAEGGYVGQHDGQPHDYDSLVREDLARGLEPVAILLGTPTEHAIPAEGDVPPATLPPSSLYEPIFADGTDTLTTGQTINPANAWAMFVFETVQRYRPGGLLAHLERWPEGQGIRHWEVWNEPDYDLFWRGSPTEYHRVLAVAYKSIKLADPDATVIFGGLAFYDKPSWFADYLIASEGAAYFEVMSVHHYLSIYKSQERLQETRRALDAWGHTDVPIWMTESGVSIWDDFPATAYEVAPDTPLRGTMQEQADYIIQHAAMAFYEGVERYYHFMLHDDCGDGISSAYGLRQNFSPHACNPAEGAYRPGYAAYQLATQEFVNLTPLWRIQDTERDVLAFYRPADKNRVIVAWARQGMTVTTVVSATGSVAEWHGIAAVGESHQPHTRLMLPATTGIYTLTLPPATNRNGVEDDVSYQIGGTPAILTERDSQPPRVTMTPLPETSPPAFFVAWQGTDFGSGVESYDVWVRVDGGGFVRWFTDSDATRVQFTGEANRRYDFAVTARDHAGNESLRPAEPHASTQVKADTTMTAVVLNADGSPTGEFQASISGQNSLYMLSQLTPTLTLATGIYAMQAYTPDFNGWSLPGRIPVSGTLPITLTVPHVDNLMQAGDFEREDTWLHWDWSGDVTVMLDEISHRAPRLGAGTGEAITCPYGNTAEAWTLQQTVSLPDTDGLTLSFGTQGTGLMAMVNDTVLSPDRVMPLPGAWQLSVVDVSAWAGQAVTLRFVVHACDGAVEPVLIDRVSLGAY